MGASSHADCCRRITNTSVRDAGGNRARRVQNPDGVCRLVVATRLPAVQAGDVPGHRSLCALREQPCLEPESLSAVRPAATSRRQRLLSAMCRPSPTVRGHRNAAVVRRADTRLGSRRQIRQGPGPGEIAERPPGPRHRIERSPDSRCPDTGSPHHGTVVPARPQPSLPARRAPGPAIQHSHSAWQPRARRWRQTAARPVKERPRAKRCRRIPGYPPRGGPSRHRRRRDDHRRYRCAIGQHAPCRGGRPGGCVGSRASPSGILTTRMSGHYTKCCFTRGCCTIGALGTGACLLKTGNGCAPRTGCSLTGARPTVFPADVVDQSSPKALLDCTLMTREKSGVPPAFPLFIPSCLA